MTLSNAFQVLLTGGLLVLVLTLRYFARRAVRRMTWDSATDVVEVKIRMPIPPSDAALAEDALTEALLLERRGGEETSWGEK